MSESESDQTSTPSSSVKAPGTALYGAIIGAIMGMRAVGGGGGGGGDSSGAGGDSSGTGEGVASGSDVAAPFVGVTAATGGG